MKTVNSISGGRSSLYMSYHYPADYEVFALVCIDDPACTPKDPGIIKYINEKLEKNSIGYGGFIATSESDKTLYLMRDFEQIIGREVIWVRGRSFDDVILNGGMKGKLTRLPNHQFRTCTETMKMFTMLQWWYTRIGEKCKMRIGFRFDEFNRIMNFFNNSNHPVWGRLPVSQKFKFLEGKHYRVGYNTKPQKQSWEDVNWRQIELPLAKDGVIKEDTERFWGSFKSPIRLKSGGWNLVFPALSNCVGCHHHKPGELCVAWNTEEVKMNWFSSQENIGLGTWKNGITYDQIKQNAENWTPEMIQGGASCDSGSCTD